MHLHGAFRDVQLLRNRLVRFAARGKREHLNLARREYMRLCIGGPIGRGRFINA